MSGAGLVTMFTQRSHREVSTADSTVFIKSWPLLCRWSANVIVISVAYSVIAGLQSIFHANERVLSSEENLILPTVCCGMMRRRIFLWLKIMEKIVLLFLSESYPPCFG